MKSSNLLIATLLCSLLYCNLSSATPLLWTLEDVILNDGTAVTGSFVWDADTEDSSFIDIHTTVGSLPGTDYSFLLATNPNGSAITKFTVINSTDPSDLAGTYLLDLFFVGDGGGVPDVGVSNAGGVVFLQAVAESYCVDSLCDVQDPQRVLADSATSARVVASPLPEPQPLALLALGLSFLGWSRRPRDRDVTHDGDPRPI